MIQRGIIAALGASALFHLGALHGFSGNEAVKIEGGAPAQAARLGNSFQDLTVGSVTSVTTDSVTEPTPTVHSTTPQTSTETSTTAPVVEALSASSATSTAATPVTPVTTEAVPIQSTRTTTTERITASEPVVVRTPTPDTPRPRARPVERPETRRPETRQPERSRPTSTPGQTREERRGQSDGQTEARANQGGERNTPGARQGNAAASNYPGIVMQKISRTRRPRVGQRGSAIVGFTVSASGGVASVRILRSSGNAQIDRAALQHIHRASPFPPPPQGATRRFQIQYDSR